MADAMAASDAGADFLVLRRELSHTESVDMRVGLPVYTPGMIIEDAWALGPQDQRMGW